MMRALQTLVALLVLTTSTLASAQQFRRPVACDSCIGNWFYKDQDPGAGRQDWNCGISSYDGHRGTDFSLSGGWAAVDAGSDVVAAAGGRVAVAVDGFFDRCTSCPASGADARCGLGFGFGFGNHVAIDHPDGTRTIYAHMRQGSVRVSVGDTVGCGQVVGQIASSGCTTGPHLHFEPRRGGVAFDPFAGRCSAVSSRWNEQGPHRGLPGASCDGTPVCPGGWYPIFNCEGSVRRRCIDGRQESEDCGPGRCVVRAVGVDDVCDADNDGVPTDEGDCDDRNAAVRPGAMEVCGNGVDDDCAGGDAGCLDARFVGQSTDAPDDPTDEAQHTACAGSPLRFQFELENVGIVPWTDINDLSPRGWGRAIRLGVPGDTDDVFVGVHRMSLNDASISSVAPGGRVIFAFRGSAPATPGIYRTSWRLVDEARGWFGPEVWLSFRVAPCDPPDVGTRDDASFSVVDARLALDARGVDARGPDAGGSPDLRGDCGCRAGHASWRGAWLLSALALVLVSRRGPRSDSQTSKRRCSPSDPR